MKANEVKILLQKYFEGESSLEEEKVLVTYFSQNEIAEEMEPYRKWFAGIEEFTVATDTDSFGEKAMAFIQKQEMIQKRKKRSLWVAVSGIAASLVIIAGSLTWYYQQPAFPDTFSDPAEAVAYAEKTLAFVSSEYNKGLSRLAPVTRLEEGTKSAGKSLKAVHKGIYQMKKIQLLNAYKTEN